MSSIAYANVINVDREAFIKKLVEVSAYLQIDPSWLMITMKIESGFNRKAINKTSGAVGLIQWIPRYVCKLLGLPNNRYLVHRRILGMSGIEQLELIKRFLAAYRGRMTDQYQTYLAVFYPAALGKNDSYIIGSRYETGIKATNYNWNKYLDTKFGNNDGKITMLDIRAFVDSHTPKDYIKPKPPQTHVIQNCRCCGRPL
jgi:hypothetical protein